MDAHEPLSMAEALMVWEKEFPQLFVVTVNYIRRAPLAGNAARRRLLTDVDFHADIVQETGIAFFRAVEKRKVWRKEATHWLARVHKRIARRLARKESILVLLTRSGDDGATGEAGPGVREVAADSPSSEAIASAREEARALCSAIPSLSELRRRTLAYLLEGVSTAEIAAAENIDERAVRKRVHDLRLQLEHYRN